MSALGLGTMGMTMAYGPSDEHLRRISAAFPDGAYGARYAEASLPAWV